MNTKWLLVITLALLLIPGIAIGAPTVYLDERQLTFTDAQPIIESNRTLVPLRSIFESMGATVSWDQDTQTATAVKGNTTVILQIGSTTPTINGKAMEIDVPAKIVSGRTLAPLRFVGEAFGGTVQWNKSSQIITIVSATSSGTPNQPNSSQQSFSPVEKEYFFDGKGNQQEFLTKETKHFIYYFTTQDKSSINDISSQLESKSQQIIEELRAGNIPKVKVKIYPDLKTLHYSVGKPDAPDWSVGTAWGQNEIRIVSPNNPGPKHNYESILKVVVHEFAHTVTLNINPKHKTWLWESIALYEAGQFRDPKTIAYLCKGEKPLFMNYTNTLINPQIYDFGYTIIEFIIKEWGIQSVHDLIVSNGDVQKVLGLSPQQFQDSWYQYVKDKYL